MTCQIEIDPDLGDSADFTQTSTPTARKEHKCGECGRAILPGEKYEYVAGKWYGDFQIHKTCADCLSVRTTLFCSYYFGSIWDELYTAIDESGGGDHIAGNLADLTPAARAKVCEIIEAYWAEKADPDSADTIGV